MTSSGNPQLRWIFYETAMGRGIVSDEIRGALTSKAARLALGELMDRIQNRKRCGATFAASVADSAKHG